MTTINGQPSIHRNLSMLGSLKIFDPVYIPILSPYNPHYNPIGSAWNGAGSGLFALLGGSSNLAADPGPRQDVWKQMGGSIKGGSPKWFMMEHPMKSYEYDLIYIYIYGWFRGTIFCRKPTHGIWPAKDGMSQTRQDTMHPYIIRTSIRKYVHPSIHPYRHNQHRLG